MQCQSAVGGLAGMLLWQAAHSWCAAINLDLCAHQVASVHLAAVVSPSLLNQAWAPHQADQSIVLLTNSSIGTVAVYTC